MIPAPADPAAAARARDAREYHEVLGLLGALGRMQDGFPIDQLTHSLQTAARAEADGFDPEVVAVALLHDIGKPLSETNHPAVVAEILRDRVDVEVYEALRHHGEFQADRNHGTSTTGRVRRRNWYSLALKLAEWDHASFDPDYPTPPLPHFLPCVHRLFFGTQDPR